MPGRLRQLTIGLGRLKILSKGAYNLTENFGNSGWKVNGKVTSPTENWEVRFEVVRSFRLVQTKRNVAYHLSISRFLLGSRLALHKFAPFLHSNCNSIPISKELLRSTDLYVACLSKSFLKGNVVTCKSGTGRRWCSEFVLFEFTCNMILDYERDKLHFFQFWQLFKIALKFFLKLGWFVSKFSKRTCYFCSDRRKVRSSTRNKSFVF